MKRYLPLIFALLVIFIVGVYLFFLKKSDTSSLVEIPLEEFSLEQNLNCFDALNSDFIITSQAESDAVASTHSPRIFCNDIKMPVVDFSQKMLLGRRVTVEACSADFTRKAYQDDIKKKIIYEITSAGEGTCTIPIINMNWVVLPASPAGYSIVFRVK